MRPRRSGGAGWPGPPGWPLPFGAVLAGRLLADRLAAARLLPVLAAVGCGYLASLAVLLAQGRRPRSTASGRTPC